jgi:3-hydroxyacyl-[acyl-carrier-protein] dehydratase
MQELTTQSAGILIAAEHNPIEDYDTSDPFHNEFALGVLVKVNSARYKGFARPGDVLTVRVSLNEKVSQVFDFSAMIYVDGKVIMRNSFQLMNIRSSVLQGKVGDS